MNSLSIWLLFIGLAMGTFALRYSFIYLFGIPVWQNGHAQLAAPCAAFCARFCFGGFGLPRTDLPLRDTRSLVGQRPFAGRVGRRAGCLADEECALDDRGGHGLILGDGGIIVPSIACNFYQNVIAKIRDMK